MQREGEGGACPPHHSVWVVPFQQRMNDEGNPGGDSSPWETAAFILPAAPCGVYRR